MDLSKLKPAEHPTDEPAAALEGWSAADLSEDELVDDEFIVADPGNNLTRAKVEPR